jgi:GT2 family glycosyltransferase
VEPVTPCSSVGQPGRPPVFVIVLNWNGWRDTVECLESLFRLDYPDYRIVVVNNGSTDGSVEHICAWADGHEQLDLQHVPADLQGHVAPPIPKPIPWLVVQCDSVWQLRDKSSTVGQNEPALIIIQTGANPGYAGGNNVGIRYALAQGAQYTWILNNDTLVDRRALGCLVRRMSLDKTIGLCGCTLLDYQEPHLVQAASGAHYDHRTSRHQSAGRGLHSALQLDIGEVEESLSYVIGASVLASRSWIEDVGLMDERYFLYFEELDWAIRGRRLGYRLGYARDSFVYHKGGVSTGWQGDGRAPTPYAQYFATRSLLAMTARFYRPWLLAIRARVIGTALKRLVTGDRELSRAILLAVFKPGLATDSDRARQQLTGSPVSEPQKRD